MPVIPTERRPLAARLHEPVDIAPLVCFRILFGAIMLWEVCRYFNHGWIEQYFIRPPFNPGYFGFEWLAPLAAPECTSSSPPSACLRSAF